MKTKNKDENETIPPMTAKQAGWLGVAGFFVMLLIELAVAWLFS